MSEPDLTPAIDYLNMMVNHLARPDDRSKQVKIGPSGLGDACDFCVAETMSYQLHPDRYIPEENNLRAMTGTAWHFWLEHLFVGQEWDDVDHHAEMRKLYVGTIDGYGEIKGTADAYSSHYATVVDFKFSSKKNLQKFKRNGLSQANEYQRHLYGKGIENAGLPIKYVANLYVPPDGYFLKDIWYTIAPYDPDKADRALARAKVIFNEFVQEDRVDDLGSDEDCFRCNRRF